MYHPLSIENILDASFMKYPQGDDLKRKSKSSIKLQGQENWKLIVTSVKSRYLTEASAKRRRKKPICYGKNRKTDFLWTPTNLKFFFYNFSICISIDTEWSKPYDLREKIKK